VVVIACVVAVFVMVIAATVLVIGRRDTSTAAADPPGEHEATAFLSAWSAGNPHGMQDLVSDPNARVAVDLLDATANLHAAGATYTLDGMNPTTDPERPEARFVATVEVGGLGPWTYHGTLPLKSTDQGYRVVWSRAVIHPQLGSAQKLERVRQRPDRAPILASDGRPLVQVQPSVTVNISPQDMKDQAALAQALHDQLGVDPTTVDADLKAPWVKPDLLVPILTISQNRYDQAKAVIHPIPGLRFTTGTSRLPLDDTFAHQLIGRTGDVTAERLNQLGPAYQQGDVVGLSGLEAAYESTLGGTPSGDIRLTDEAGTLVHDVDHIAGLDPKPLKTTLDIATQTAAEAAVAGVTAPLALVATDATGAIRAVVSRPLTDDFDRALAGQYPPGSTFKVVTTAALLAHGQTPASQLTCPTSVTVDGKVFTNFEGEHGGQLSLTDAFATSCNTAFIGATKDLAAPDLVGAAAQFGFGTKPDLGVLAVGGTVPTPTSPVELAATTIGQGGVQASPLQMAEVAATVQSGQWHHPRLVTDPPTSPGSAASTGSVGSSAVPAVTTARAADPAPLDAGIRQSLTELMHAVVDRGTGTAAAVAGRDVAGKTGTAEFGTANPPATHAWFIGFTPQLSFAIVIEGGGAGGAVAAPVAAKFVSSLPA
jgi:cell division protein FtsI/penicillin-binding protein 2